MPKYRITHVLAAGVMCLCASAALAADGKPTADEVKALTHKAAVFVTDKGIDEARAAFNREGEFKHGEVYVNVIDSKGAWVIYPPRPDGAGKVVINIKDADGKFLVQEILRLATEQNE